MEHEIDLNRVHNARNPYQTDAKKVLCVCSAGLLRSPTAANVLHEKYGYNTRAVGIDSGHALIPLDYTLLFWADEVVVMNYEHRRIIKWQYGEEPIMKDKPILVLDIPDQFGWNDPKLRQLIAERYEEQLSSKES
jgi:predicted protein tyrosine phosphatase